MKKLARFFKTTLIGGFVVILPVLIILAVFKWMFDSIIERIEPITAFIVTSTQFQRILADSISVMIIIVICFLVGLLVRTRLGSFIYGFFEDKLLKRIPGYRMVKETISQFFLADKRLFSSVALVNLFGDDIMVTALITDEHSDGSFTVFLPTAPNPTSGNIFHVRGDRVHKLDISIEEAMKTVISCGVGSKRLFEQLFEQDRGPKEA